MNELYNVRQTRDGFRVVKFDKWFNVMAIYELTSTRFSLQCPCPQANAPECRHRKMVRLFERRHLISSGWFYCYDTGDWIQPINVRTWT